jgi:hypothetical protein
MQEDYYMHECLVYLGVKDMKDYKILGEQYCTWDWADCKSARVTFHPLKTLKQYQSCVWNAEHYGSWWA